LCAYDKYTDNILAVHELALFLDRVDRNIIIFYEVDCSLKLINHETPKWAMNLVRVQSTFFKFIFSEWIYILLIYNIVYLHELTQLYVNINLSI
jgi:hypothetical protein